MSRTTLFILVKYMVFLNWTLTGFWIIYNSSDYSKNAQIISEKISSMYQNVNKQSVVYGLIIYTIIISCVTFFGLVGVCYENFVMTFCLAFSYLVYIIFDITSNALIGVPFNLFMILLQILLILTCINLFYLSWLIHCHVEVTDEVTREGGVPLTCIDQEEDQSLHHTYQPHHHHSRHHSTRSTSSQPPPLHHQQQQFASRVDFYDNTCTQAPHFESIALR